MALIPNQYLLLRFKIVLFLIALTFINGCKQPHSIESKKEITTNAQKKAFGLVMNNHRILDPISIEAKQGKAYQIIFPKATNELSTKKITESFIYTLNLTTDNGLALDVIVNSDKSCLCDSQGNLWFATGGGGVSKYNGKSFTNYTTDHGLANNLALSIIEDKNGNIWIGTGDGVSCYNGNLFINYTQADGLINNVVRSITEDKYGNIWFSTEGGISKFDGKQFTNYTTKDGLPENIIVSSFEDKNGNLWFGSQTAGLIRCSNKNTNFLCNTNTCKHNLKLPQSFELHKKQITPSFITFSTINGLSNNSVLCFYQDNIGNLLFGTYGGVCELPANQLNHTCPLKTCNHKLIHKKEFGAQQKENSKSLTVLDNNIGPGKIVYNIKEDQKGNIWFATELGFSFYDKKKFTDFTTEQILSIDNASGITMDKRNNIWFSTFGAGINLFEGKGVMNYTKKNSIINNLITSIYEDKNGAIYFAEYGSGLFSFNGTKESKIELGEVVGNKIISCLFTAKNGNLGFGILGNGICLYDGQNIINYTTEDGLIYNKVTCCIKDNKEHLWIGTEKGLSCFDGKNFINFNTAQGLVDNNIFCIYQDSGGNLWFGTPAGLSCYNGKIFTNYTTKQGLANNYIYAITEDKFKNLWIAMDGGVCRYDGKSFLNYTTAEGLPNNVVTQIIISNEQHVVLGTNKGLALLTDFRVKNNNQNNKKTLEQKRETTIPIINNLSNSELNLYLPAIEVYNAATGYHINDVNFGCNSMFKDSKGVIWVGTGSDKTGLVRFDYSALNKNRSPLNVRLENIQINKHNICWKNLNKPQGDKKLKAQQEFLIFNKSLTDKERKNEARQFGDIKFDSVSKFYNVPQNLVLPYHSNTITFEYAAIEPARPKLVKYQYMLEGFDNDWEPISNKKDVTYGNLNEGTYTFKVRAANQYNVWNQPLHYTFTVLPPYHRTYWAYCFYLIGFLGIVLGYNYFRSKNIKRFAQLLILKIEEERQRISRDLHDDLGQELLYLKMNSETKNKPSIDRILNKIRAISYNLSPIKIIDSSIKDLLLELITEAEKSNLFLSYEIDDIFIKSNDIKINLYRIAQEALNNTIKHANAENARLTVKKTDNYLMMEIQDNGVGISYTKNSKTIGLSSMKERAKIINAEILIGTTPMGTSIKIKLKLPEK
jgi:ligand-binding sensor domain-containing protein